MAFMDKLGQMANKVGEVAGDTFDYGKAKGKIVLEKGKIKVKEQEDIKEDIGEYVYSAIKEDGQLNMDRIMAFCAEIDEHMAEIDKLNDDASKSSEGLNETFGGKE